MDTFFVRIYPPADAFVQSVLIPQTSFNQLCYFLPSSLTQLFPGFILAFICLLLCWQKGTLCPHIYKSSFMCLQQVEICCHMNLWHRAVRKAGKVNKEDLHYHKPCTSRASIRSCLHPLLLIIPQTPHNETELEAKALVRARRSCEEGLSYLVSASFLSC